jgi:predicted double-glycine peptidase
MEDHQAKALSPLRSASALRMQMIPWLETLGVAALAAAGWLLGRWFSRRPGRWWLAGYLLPAALLAVYGLARHNSQWEFVPPVSWLLAGRTEFALAGFIVTLILITPLSRLKQANQRRAVAAFAVFLVLIGSLWPFVAPAFNRGLQSSLQTQLDADGVCRQGTEYNCGPAAAVTALRRMGLPAEEGEIAILAHTSTAIGTPPDLLVAAIQKRFGPMGVRAEYRHFRTVAELRDAGVVVVVIKFALLTDHYVTILDVDDRQVTVGDPWKGKQVYSAAEFARVWRFTGIVLWRGPSARTRGEAGRQQSVIAGQRNPRWRRTIAAWAQMSRHHAATTCR